MGLAKYLNRIVSVYGIGADEFLDLFQAQSHACGVCKRSLVMFSSDPAERPVVDHNHVTGEVRGILCGSCNICIGWLEKDPDRTRKCIDYLTRGYSATRLHPPEESASWSSRQWRDWRLGQKRTPAAGVLKSLRAKRLGL